MPTTRRDLLAGGALLTSATVSVGFGASAAGNATPERAGLEAPNAKRSTASLNTQLLYQRAVEAVIWSVPAMCDVFVREGLFRDFGMRPGDLVVWSKPMRAETAWLTANTQVNYAAMPYDLSKGPLVVEIPPSDSQYSIIGQLCDNWGLTVTMIGIDGPDKGKGGKYLLLPPGHTNSIPAGYLPVQMEGLRGLVFFRPVIIGGGTMEGAVALARRTRSYSMAEAANPKPTRVLDGYGKPLNTLPVYDVSYFEHLAKFIDDEPVRERDKVAVGMLSTLGIEKGVPFAPDSATRGVLQSAVTDAYALMQEGFVGRGKALDPWWPDRQWMFANLAIIKNAGVGWSYETHDAVLTYQRAILPFFWANYLPASVGSSGDQQLYIVGIRDAKGKLLSGKLNYRVRMPANVPVDKFWSVIAYSQKTKSLIPNSLDQCGIDSYHKADLKVNADGSLDIHLGATAPAGMEKNFLPSSGEDFFLFLRLYGPGKAVYDKSWKMPDIEQI